MSINYFINIGKIINFILFSNKKIFNNNIYFYLLE